MLPVKKRIIEENIDYREKLELYRLMGDGYRAMQEGRESTIEEVEERIRKRRAGRG